MPLSKSRNKSALRRQDIMSTPRKVFKELYFTKSAMKAKERLKGQKSLTAKEEAQTAAKYRYVINPESVLWRKPVKDRSLNFCKTRTIQHFRH